MAAAKYLGLFISIGISAILARLLMPEDFAVVAIATVLIGFISLVTSNGLSPAIIQNKNLNTKNINDLYSYTFYFAFILSFLFILLSPLIAQFYSDERLELICIILSINVFFSILSIVPNALLYKDKNFKLLAVRTIIIHFFAGILSVTWALLGGGVYSLLINPVLNSILIYIVCIYYYPMKFYRKPEISSLKMIFSFSFYQVLFNVLNYSYRNLDKLLVGKYISMASLGYYEKSYRLMMLPLENISAVINPVLHPLLSEYQNSMSFIREKYMQLLKFSSYIGFFLSIFLFFTADEVIRILYGPQWESSILVFKIFALSIGIQIIQSGIGAIFQALNKVKIMFWASLISCFITVVSILYGIYLGSIEFLAICIVVAFVLAFFIYHIALFKNIFRSPFYIFLFALWKPLLVNLIIGFILFCYTELIFIENDLLNLTIKFLISVLLILLMYIMKIIDLPVRNLLQRKQK